MYNMVPIVNTAFNIKVPDRVNSALAGLMSSVSRYYLHLVGSPGLG